jgi:hypothetical protein
MRNAAPLVVKTHYFPPGACLVSFTVTASRCNVMA